MQQNFKYIIWSGMVLFFLASGYFFHKKSLSVGRAPETLSEAEKALVGKWVKVKQKSLVTQRERYFKQISHHYLRRTNRGTQSLPHINYKSTMNFWRLNLSDSTFEIEAPVSHKVSSYTVDYFSDSIFIYTSRKDSIQYYEMRYTGEFLKLPKEFWLFQ